MRQSTTTPMATEPDNTALFTEIARKHLGIETLETRNSDSLDFHDVGVGCLVRGGPTNCF